MSRMEVKTINGIVLHDDDFDRLAEEFENGTWSGHSGKVVLGRPKIMNEELVNVTFRIPQSRLIALERAVKNKGKTRSEYLREALDKALVDDAC